MERHSGRCHRRYRADAVGPGATAQSAKAKARGSFQKGSPPATGPAAASAPSCSSSAAGTAGRVWRRASLKTRSTRLTVRIRLQGLGVETAVWPAGGAVRSGSDVVGTVTEMVGSAGGVKKLHSDARRKYCRARSCRLPAHRPYRSRCDAEGRDGAGGPGPRSGGGPVLEGQRDLLAQSAALVGVDAVPVDVEVDVSPGRPAFAIAGLPDASEQDAEERCRW